MLIHRRTVLAAGGAMLFAPTMRVRGANEDVRIAVVGIGGKGSAHVQDVQRIAGVRLVAVCDPDRTRAGSGGEKAKLPSAACHTDIRSVLDDKEIDAIIIAAPNHWHALGTIWACQAGKDVYVEKPASHDLWEGRQMLAAARKYDRIVQVGTQRRSDPHLAEAFAAIRSGEFGAIQRVRVIHYEYRPSIGKLAEPKGAPAEVDYDLWCGPAPMRQLTRPRLHYDWHWFWETGNGDLGNSCPHHLDLVRWVLGDPALPPRAFSIGARLGVHDAAETANTQVVFFDSPEAPIVVELRNLPRAKGTDVLDQYRGLRAGIVVECEGADFVGMTGGGFFDKQGTEIRKVGGDGGRDHQANFVKAVRSRSVKDLNCDIAQGELSAALCHMGNTSHRLGTPTAPSQIEQVVGSNALVAEHYDAILKHLAANEIDPNEEWLAIGPVLQIDPVTKQFIGEHAAAANGLQRRDYRTPFVIPQEI